MFVLISDVSDLTFNMDTLEGRESPRGISKRHEGSACRLMFTTMCVCMGSFSFGYVIGYSSPAIPALESAGLLDRDLSGWFASLMTVGALFGGPLAGYCIEQFGRKSTINLSSFPFFLGWFCLASAGSATSLLIGRFLCGVASGMITVSVPVYIAEIATSSLRGFLGSCVQLTITVGILASYVFGMSMSWSAMASLGCVFSVVTMVSMCFVPETPRWLLLNDQKMEAVKSLRQLRSQHADCEEEIRDIAEGLDVKESFTWSEFKKPELSRPLMISVIILVFQQTSGINAVMFYTVSIFKTAGIQNSEMATVLIGVVQVVATFVACLLMDRTGRRRLLITAGSIMALSCFVFGVYYYNKDLSQDWGMLAVFSLVLYIIGFSLGWGPIPMLIMSEIFPSRVRGAASGVAMFTSWTTAFIVTKEFLFIQDLLGPAMTFWLFSFSCVCSALFVWRKVPETKGKSLEDIELYFLGKSMMYS